jgi:hypothetical protein
MLLAFFVPNGFSLSSSLLFLFSLSARSSSYVIKVSAIPHFVRTTNPQTHTGDKKQALYNLFSAYICTMPLEELIESVKRARLDAKLRYVVIYGAVCSYCLGKAERLDGSYLRTFAVELKEQLAQTLAAFVTSILNQPRGCADAERAEPYLRQIIDVLQQVMCPHDAEKLAISVLEIYERGAAEELS